MQVDTDAPFENFQTIGNNNYQELQQCVKDIIKDEGYKTYSVSKNVFTPDGGNFLGILCEVDIDGETTKGKKETNIFMKIITPNDQMTIISLPEAYKTELFAYKELSPIFTELQNEVNVPIKDQYRIVKSYAQSNQNAIILENMNKRGFKTNFRMDLITLDYAEMAIGELAKFHALSFVLESRRPNYFAKKIKTINAIFSFNKDWEAFVQNMCQITLNYLDKHSRRKMEDFNPSFYEKYRKYLEGKTGRLCLRHGDYRPNNILLKETNGKLSAMIPIDYQLICYGCPVLDLIYFIFSSTDQQFRRTNLPHLKELYHDTLRSFLKHFSLDVDRIYPRKDFERDYKNMLDYGLMIGILLIPLLMACEGDVPNIAGEPIAGLNFNVDAKCGDRLVGIVSDFIEWGYL